jgi:hypothetical protein
MDVLQEQRLHPNRLAGAAQAGRGGIGPIAFAPGNPTFTSSRRPHRGLVYNILVTCLCDCVLFGELALRMVAAAW